MKFYHIKDEYIDYLKKFDTKKAGFTRPASNLSYIQLSNSRYNKEMKL